MRTAAVTRATQIRGQLLVPHTDASSPSHLLAGRAVVGDGVDIHVVSGVGRWWFSVFVVF